MLGGGDENRKAQERHTVCQSGVKPPLSCVNAGAPGRIRPARYREVAVPHDEGAALVKPETPTPIAWIARLNRAYRSISQSIFAGH